MSFYFNQIETNYPMDINKPIPRREPVSYQYAIHNDNSTDSPITKNSFLSQLETFLHENFADFELSNTSIAKHMGLSNRQLYRNVQKAVGLTPNQYITKFRVHKAKVLMSSGRLYTAKEVALLVGYKKSSYFSQLFKNEFQLTPFEFLCSIGVRQNQSSRDN